MFSEAAQDVAESHPLLLRGTHALAERYLSLPHVVKRIREVTWPTAMLLQPCALAKQRLTQRRCCRCMPWCVHAMSPRGPDAGLLPTSSARSSRTKPCSCSTAGLQIRHAWQYRVPPCPQLYLYSEAGEHVGLLHEGCVVPWQPPGVQWRAFHTTARAGWHGMACLALLHGMTCHALPAQTKPSHTYAFPTDALIPYHHVELFMQQQSAHGIPVHHHRWVDSAHCEHLRWVSMGTACTQPVGLHAVSLSAHALKQTLHCVAHTNTVGGPQCPMLLI